MARKPKPKMEGAPLWMVTYGDMVTLLLTFFVMLSSLANYDDVDERFMAAIQSIREALGMSGQAGRMVDPSVDFHSMIHRLESIIKPDEPRERGDSDEEGIYGKHFRLRQIRDGMEITIGGPILFEPFSAQMTDKGKESLTEIADILKGHRNKIEIRGHAAEQPRPDDWTDDDALELSYERAKAVRTELVLGGVDPRTIRLVAVGATEPVARKVSDLDKSEHNRRVEIIVRESVIDDYADRTPGSPATQPAGVPAPGAAPADSTRSPPP